MFVLRGADRFSKGKVTLLLCAYVSATLSTVKSAPAWGAQHLKGESTGQKLPEGVPSEAHERAPRLCRVETMNSCIIGASGPGDRTVVFYAPAHVPE
jgi:hypothetical protein